MGEVLVSGLTIIRNGLRLDYPFLEVIRSALPICDEYVVVVGDSDDGTREAVVALGDPKIRIIDTVWSPLVTPRKCTLAQQTNIGLHQCRGRWCLSLQGNEVLHERDLPHIRSLLEQHAHDPRIEALLFERLTFWADYQHIIAVYPDLFKFTVRAIKPHIGAHSIRDAMSFAIFDSWSTHGRYARAVDSGCHVYRYSGVRRAEVMATVDSQAVHRQGGPVTDPNWMYTRYPRQFIRAWTGRHPAVMAERMAAFPPQYDLADPRCRDAMTWRERLRVMESAWYHRCGLPRRRASRYELIGNYQPKQRPV